MNKLILLFLLIFSSCKTAKIDTKPEVYIDINLEEFKYQDYIVYLYFDIINNSPKDVYILTPKTGNNSLDFFDINMECSMVLESVIEAGSSNKITKRYNENIVRIPSNSKASFKASGLIYENLRCEEFDNNMTNINITYDYNIGSKYLNDKYIEDSEMNGSKIYKGKISSVNTNIDLTPK